MSTPLPQTRLPRLAGQAVQKARLTVVPRTRRARAPRIPFLALVSLVLVGGVIGLLMFNTSLQQASFAASDLEDEAASLTARQEVLEMEIDELRDPQRLAREAQRLGMVIPATTAYLRTDGTLVGQATPAQPQPFRIDPKPATKPKSLNPKPVLVEDTTGATGTTGTPGAPGTSGNQESGGTPASQPGAGAGNR